MSENPGFNAILKQNKLNLIPESEIVHSYYNEYGDNEDLKACGKTYKVEVDPVEIPQQDAIRDEVHHIQGEDSSLCPKPTFEDKSISASIESKKDFDITKNSAKMEKSLTSVRHHQEGST